MMLKTVSEEHLPDLGDEMVPQPSKTEGFGGVWRTPSNPSNCRSHTRTQDMHIALCAAIVCSTRWNPPPCMQVEFAKALASAERPNACIAALIVTCISGVRAGECPVAVLR